jgi:hypothetical protein
VSRSRSIPPPARRTSSPTCSTIWVQPRQGEQVTIVRSAIGSEQGYLTRVARFFALGFTCADFRIHVHDLPDGIGIDGLLGLSFLRQLHYEIRSDEGRILARRIPG